MSATMNKPQHCAAIVFDASAQHELGEIVAHSYDEIWRIAKGLTPHPVLQWIEGGPTGKEVV